MTRDQLIFKATGSVRYHRYRAEHFAKRNRWIAFISIFSGTGVVAGIVAQYPNVSLALGIIIAFLNTYALVTKPEEVSKTHEKWCGEWSKLLGEVDAVPHPTEQQLSKWTIRASNLDGQCMDDMKAVKAHAFNDAVTALGRGDKPYEISWFQSWTKNFLAHSHGFDRQNQAFAAQAKKARGQAATG